MKPLFDFLFVKKGFMIIMLPLFIIVLFFFHNKANHQLLMYEFNGRIEYIKYDQKRIATITVNREEFYLGGALNCSTFLNIGDSIIKNKNEMSLKIIKQKNGKEILIHE